MVFHGEVGEMEDLFKGISREVKVKINGIFINLSLINIGGEGVYVCSYINENIPVHNMYYTLQYCTVPYLHGKFTNRGIACDLQEGAKFHPQCTNFAPPPQKNNFM